MIGALLDFGAFLLARHLGVSLLNAHLMAFAVGAVTNYVARTRPAAARGLRSLDARLHLHLLVVALFALFVRGAVLGLLANVAGWPALAAIVPAIMVTSMITLPGNALAVHTRRWIPGEGHEWQVTAMALIACGFLLRLLYITQVELLPEDAYYWNYSQHLAMGYLDHPPMVAWLIWVGTHMFGNTEFGVRVGAFGCALLSSWFVYRLTRNLFNQSAALIALLLMQALPYFFLSGMLMTPDAPMSAAWAGSLYFLERALVAGQGRAWLLAGLSIGLGLISKYTVGMLVPAAVLFVVLDPQSRRWLLRWEPYVAMVMAAIVFSPVIIWNAQHDWASFAFQTSRRLAEAPRFSLHRLLLSMLVLLTPTGLITLLASRFTRSGPANAGSRGWLFIRCVVLVPLAVFFVFSLQHDVKIDWTGALWTGAVPGLAAAIAWFAADGSTALQRRLSAAWGPTVVIMMLVYGAGLHYLALGLPGVPYSSHLELVPVGWRDLGRQVQALAAKLRSQSGREPVIVGMNRYEIASELAFYSPDPPQAVRQTSSRNVFGQQGLMYAPWAVSLNIGDRPLLLVAWDAPDLADSLITPYVGSAEPPGEGLLSRDGVAIRNFRYRIVQGWHPGTSTAQ